MMARAVIPVPAVVSPELRQLAREYLDVRNFEDVLYLVNSGNRLSCLRALWRFIPEANRASILAIAISTGDAPVMTRAFLCRALRSLRGTPVADSDRALAALSALPEVVTLFRGTNEREVNSGNWSISWTLDAERAQWFATEHGRFRVRDATPVVVTAAGIKRENVAGLLLSRGERGALVLPEVIAQAKVSWKAASK